MPADPDVSNACLFMSTVDVCGTRRNGKVVKVITVVTESERYDDVTLKEGK